MAKTVDLEKGWEEMKKGMAKLKATLEGQSDSPFDSEESVKLYTTIFNLCTQNRKSDHTEYAAELYKRYRSAINEYINETVLPSLRKKHGIFFLRELQKRWSNHNIMVRWLSKFFSYLDRYYVVKQSLPNLAEAGKACFHDLVYNEMKDRAKDEINFFN